MSSIDFATLARNAEERLFIIAEAGVNHNGDIRLARKLVDAAVESGADAVKFQTWITEKVFSRSRSIKADYQQHTTDAAESAYDMIKKLELGFDAFRELKAYCDEKGIICFSTPDEPDSANFLAEIGMPLMKTSSQDVTNVPFLRHVARLGKPIIFSTGASTLSELVEAAEAIRSETDEMMILHCVSCYPAPVEQMNLNFITTLKRMFSCPIGFSDHTPGQEVACAAVALGARIFEKHLTLDRSMAGPDHQASLEPAEFRAYVTALRDVRKALGDGFKRVMPCEEDTRKAIRRFLVAARDLPAGAVIGEQDLCSKRVLDGIAPRFTDQIIGARLRHAIAEDTPIDWDMLAWH